MSRRCWGEWPIYRGFPDDERDLGFGSARFAGPDSSPIGGEGGAAAGGGSAITGTQSVGAGVHLSRSGGVSQMARNSAACKATATPNHTNNRRRLGGALRLKVSVAMIAGEMSRYCEGGGSSGMGSRDLGGRRSGNLMTRVTSSF